MSEWANDKILMLKSLNTNTPSLLTHAFTH